MTGIRLTSLTFALTFLVLGLVSADSPLDYYAVLTTPTDLSLAGGNLSGITEDY